jgi:hypothetical protein
VGEREDKEGEGERMGSEDLFRLVCFFNRSAKIKGEVLEHTGVQLRGTRYHIPIYRRFGISKKKL